MYFVARRKICFECFHEEVASEERRDVVTIKKTNGNRTSESATLYSNSRKKEHPFCTTNA